MAGKRDKNIVCVVSNLTSNQASKLSAEIIKAKNNVAPQSRATSAITTREGIGSLLQKSVLKIGIK